MKNLGIMFIWVRYLIFFGGLLVGWGINDFVLLLTGLSFGSAGIIFLHKVNMDLIAKEYGDEEIGR